MTAKKAPEPETARYRMGNAHATSVGHHLPGDEVELPVDEGQPLVAAGYAVRLP